jgi:hypothetical protein
LTLCRLSGGVNCGERTAPPGHPQAVHSPEVAAARSAVPRPGPSVRRSGATDLSAGTTATDPRTGVRPGREVSTWYFPGRDKESRNGPFGRRVGRRDAAGVGGLNPPRDLDRGSGDRCATLVDDLAGDGDLPAGLVSEGPVQLFPGGVLS